MTRLLVLLALASCDGKGVTISASGVNDRAHCVVDINQPDEPRVDASTAKQVVVVSYPVFIRIPVTLEKP